MTGFVAGKRGERGSALLIVFVFAAIIAIMLYMELPVAVFEAQRQKEQLLIGRGNEYAHAVKLFVRKLGTYPASIEALEKTNNMRFLRHRFKDPFTGKDDWRLLHAGANGMLLDSKVKPLNTGQNGNRADSLSGLSSNGARSSPGGASGSSGAPGSNNSGGLGSFGSGSANTDSTPPEVVIKTPPQRAPEMAANGGAQTGTPSAGQDPLAPLLPPGQTDAAQPSNQSASTGGNGAAGQAGSAGQNTAGQTAPGQPGSGETTAANGDPTAQAGNPAGATRSGLGVINTGGIAGVASRAAGKTIKLVNDQTDYSLWEFYYDPTKDATKGIANAIGALGANQQGNQQGNQQANQQANQQGTGIGANSSFFGNNNGTSGITNSSPTSSTPSTGTTSQQTPNQ